jgi:magnesium-transporting ATPase (P-type)
MELVGLMAMENRLKKETVGYLSLYAAAFFRLCMITGDNPLTAAAVAKMAGGEDMKCYGHPGVTGVHGRVVFAYGT